MIGIFTKAGKPGWAAIIPFYNNWVLGEIVYGKGNGWKGFLVFIPVVGFIPGIMFLVRIAQVFGFGLLVALLNVLCGIVVLPIIALTGDYQGPVDSFI